MSHAATIMSNQDDHDLQDYPETPLSQEFLVHVARALEQRKDGTMTIAEVATTIIDHILTMDPSVLAELQGEHEATIAFYERKSHEAEYERLKAELNRVSAATRLIMDSCEARKKS